MEEHFEKDAFIGAVYEVLRSQLPCYAREGMISGMCETAKKFGVSDREIKMILESVVGSYLKDQRERAVIIENEINMLIRIKDFA